MKKIKNILFKISLLIQRLRNTIYRRTHKFNKSITIVSSSKYKNKVKEDLKLEYYLLKNEVNAKIKSWEEDINDNVIIRSTWGYQNNLDKYTKFINNLSKKVINPKKIILDNMDKEKQYKLFIKHKLPHIDTTFIKNVNDLQNLDISEKTVLKPCISASGQNAFLIKTKKDLNKAIETYKEKNINNIMIQPFIKNIKDGELAIVVIDNKIEYAIIRFPGIFTKAQSLRYIYLEELDQTIIDLVEKIIKIKEYKDTTFMRIDLIKIDDIYKILEIELLDPQLYIETIPDKKERKKVYQEFAKAIKKKL